MARGQAKLPLVASAITAVPAVGNIHSTGHIHVIDAAASLRLDAEILSDLGHVDAARSVVLHDHRAAHIGGGDASRAVALDYERARNVADFDLARAIVHG